MMRSFNLPELFIYPANQTTLSTTLNLPIPLYLWSRALHWLLQRIGSTNGHSLSVTLPTTVDSVAHDANSAMTVDLQQFSQYLRASGRLGQSYDMTMQGLDD